MSRRLILVLLCLGCLACTERADRSGDDDEPQVTSSGGVKGRSPRIIQLARVEGYGNARTGELWVRAIPTVEGIKFDAPKGVAVSAQPLPVADGGVGLDPGYCEVNVVSDMVRDSNPPDTFEFYTEDIDGTQTASSMDNSSFDWMECLGHVPVGNQPLHSSQFSAFGAGCALQHVGNFTSMSFSRVFLDVDVFNGDYGCSGAYGPPFGSYGDGTGSVDTPATEARNEPQAALGLWDFGSMDPYPAASGLKNMWIYFKNCPGAVDFNWTGFLLAEVVETCGDMVDDDCDGVADNGCGAFADGMPCYTDNDCLGGVCTGATIVSGIGQGGGALGDDTPGTCGLPPDCDPPLGPIGYGLTLGTTTGTGDDYAGSCPGGTGAAEVIYQFTAPATEQVCIDTFGSLYDTQLYVLTSCGQLASEIACNDDANIGLYQSQVEITTTMGTDYFVVVDGYSLGQEGPFNLNVVSGACPPPPPVCGDLLCAPTEDCLTCPVDCGTCLDDCSTAVPIIGYTQYIDANTTGAGDDQTATCGPSLGEDRIFAFTAPATETVCVDTLGASYETILSVQTTCGDNLTEVGCVDPPYDAGELEFAATMGVTYYIVVDGNNASGYTQLNVTQGPCASHCAGYCGNNSPSGCWCDTACEMYGDCCPGDSRCADCGLGCCGNGTCDPAESCATCPADCGGPCPDCSSPPIAALGVNLGDNTTSGNDYVGSCSPSAGADMFYEFTSPVTGDVCVDTFGSAKDTVLYVHEPYCADPIYEIACNDDAWSGKLQSELKFSANLGNVYYIAVDGYSSTAQGPFTLNINSPCTAHCASLCGGGPAGPGCYCDPTCLATGDCCSDACETCGICADCSPPLSAATFGTYVDSTLGENDDYVGSCSPSLGQDLTYEFIAPNTETICIDTIGTAFDTTLYVRDACNPSANELACNDDSLLDGLLQSKLQMNVTMGVGYYIVVDGYDSVDQGAFTLHITQGSCCPPGSTDTLGNGTQCCGDGVRMGSEECDDGNLVDGDGCDMTCQLECGNGAPDAGEECDDGNNLPGDGCDPLCNVECPPMGLGINQSPMFDDMPMVMGMPGDLMAFKYTAPCSVRINRLDVFTGEQTGTNTLGLWTDVAGAPGSQIAGGSWTMSSMNGFQGAPLDSLVSIAWNQPYWVVWGPVPGSQAPAEMGGMAVETRISMDGGTMWGPGMMQPQKFRPGALKTVKIEPGNYHNCARTDRNTVHCWGQNNIGQIGDNSMTNRTRPVDVTGSFADWIDISGGLYHTCGIRSPGAMYCWGNNANAQFGNNGTVDSQVPMATSGGLVFASAATGYYHSCGITTSGTLYCWGANGYGQLGDNTTTQRKTPRQEFSGATTWTRVAGSIYSTCGIRAGAMYCWGDNYYGQLGDGTTIGSFTPYPVAGGITDFVELAMGAQHTCGLRSTGQLYCWGYNADGELGDGTNTDKLMPTLVQGGITDWVQVVAGTLHTCARRSTGQAYCWGSNTSAQLGDGTTIARNLPVQVSGAYTDWQSLGVGGYFSCGARTGGRAFCWGSNTYGQLGNGTYQVFFTPTGVLSY